MVVGIGGNVLNAVLSYTLIYGRFGAPALGAAGGGYGTATTEWIEALVLLALLARDQRRAGARSTLGLGAAMREVFAVGGPTGAQFGAEVIAFASLTAVLGTIGVEQVAAHQIALATIRVSFLPGMAVAEASCVLVGRALGGRDLRAADRANRAALALAGGFMACCGIAFAFGGDALARAFTPDLGVAMITRRLLWIAAVFQLLDAFNVVLRGSLRGAKDVRVAALLGVGIVWTTIPVAAFLLGKEAGLGALGGWLGFLAETTLGATIFWVRWSRGSWRRAYEGAPAVAA
jgi:MATE family multidrug resistance protein